MKTLLVYGLTVVGLVVLFAVFIAVKSDASLVAALSAAGTVAAGGFAAVAALGSMRAAAESSAAARRSREAFARTVRPQLRPVVVRQDGTLHGRLECAGDRAAIDVQAVWLLANHATRSERMARLEPGGVFTLDLGLPDTATAGDLEMVWLEYWDDGRLGQWHETWRPDPDAADGFVQSDASLVD